jgi:ribosomal protein L14
MMIVFSDIRGIVHVNWVPEGKTVNQVHYKEVLTTVLERMRRHKMWKNGSWVVHQDNAPAQNTLSVKAFFMKHKITAKGIATILT